MTRAQPAAAALVFSLAASGAVAEGPARLLADFEAEPSGDPSGQAIVRAPSTAVVRLVTDGEGHALEVSGRQAPSGLAGIRVSFRDARGRAAPVDSSGHDYLTFRIRSTGGPSRLQVRIADAVAAALASIRASRIVMLMRRNPSLRRHDCGRRCDQPWHFRAARRFR